MRLPAVRRRRYSDLCTRTQAMETPPDRSPNNTTLLWRDGRIERDTHQAAVVNKLDKLREAIDEARLAKKSSALGWLFGARRPESAGQGSVHLGIGRARQDHADGPVLRVPRAGAEAARPFPRLHGRRPQADLRLATEEKGQCGQGRRPHRSRGGRAGQGRDAAVLRRIRGHRHHRRHDPRTAVPGALGAQRDRGRHLQRRSRRPLQGRPQPRPVPALHRHDPGQHGGGETRRPQGFPAGAARKRAGLAHARRRPRAAGPRQGLCRVERRRQEAPKSACRSSDAKSSCRRRPVPSRGSITPTSARGRRPARRISS